MERFYVVPCHVYRAGSDLPIFIAGDIMFPELLNFCTEFNIDYESFCEVCHGFDMASRVSKSLRNTPSSVRITV